LKGRQPRRRPFLWTADRVPDGVSRRRLRPLGASHLKRWPARIYQAAASPRSPAMLISGRSRSFGRLGSRSTMGQADLPRPAPSKTGGAPSASNLLQIRVSSPSLGGAASGRPRNRPVSLSHSEPASAPNEKLSRYSRRTSLAARLPASAMHGDRRGQPILARSSSGSDPLIGRRAHRSWTNNEWPRC